jgi:DNA repair protein SbcC/Rad50
VQLVELELDNFRQHLHSLLRFEDGVTGIIGRNGAGKTTVLEAIAWALYGAPALRGANDTIRCRSSQGGAKPQVRLVFSLGGHTYTVIRKLDGASLAIDGVGARTGLTEVSKSVAQLLKMDYRAFFTSFFTEQKSLTFMAGLDGRQKASAVSRMLGYDRLTRAREQANKDKLLMDREISGLEQGLGNPEEIHQRLAAAKKAVSEAEKAVKESEASTEIFRAQITELKPRKALSDEAAKRHEQISQRLALDKTQYQSALDRHSELDKTLAGIIDMAKELADMAPMLEEFKTAEAEYRRMQDLQKHEVERQGINRDLARLDEECEQLEARLRDLANAREDQQKAAAAVTDLEGHVKDVQTSIEMAREQWMVRRSTLAAETEALRRTHEQISHKRTEIETAGKEGRCPACERELGKDLATVLSNFDGQIESADSRLSEIRRELNAIQDQPEELTKLTTHRASIESELTVARKAREESDAAVRELTTAQKDLTTRRAQEATLKEQLKKLPSGFDQDKMDSLAARGRELKPTERRSIVLQSEVEKKPGVEKELSRLSKDIEIRAQQVATADKLLHEMAFSPEEHAKLAVEFESTSTRLQQSELETERLRGNARTAMTEFANVDAEDKAYKAKEVQLKKKRTERLYLSTLSDAFDRLRIDLDGRTRPELEASASELLSEMTDGRYSSLEINDSYQATIRDDGELKPVISGGEDDVVNLALRLAISQMIADRAGQPFSLLILDEVFGSLDESRRGNVIDMLLNLKNRFRQIIVITHIEAIYDMVDNCIWVDYDEKQKICRIADRRPTLSASYDTPNEM